MNLLEITPLTFFEVLFNVSYYRFLYGVVVAVMTKDALKI